MRVGRAGGLLALLVVAGCSSTAPPTTYPSVPDPINPSTSAPNPAATLVPGGPRCPASDVVGKALGMALGVVQETPLPQAGVECDYDGMRTAAGAMTGVSLSLGRGVDASRFADVRGYYVDRGLFLTELPGIGDEAFTVTTPALGLVVTHVIARQGDLLVTLVAQASLEQEVALVKAIFAA